MKHTRNTLRQTTDGKSERRRYIRFGINLFGIMVLFGITWVLAAFTIRGASLFFQILFAVFNSLQGFFIFFFFCVLSSDVRQQWKQLVTCGRYVKGKPAYSTSGNRNFNADQLRSGANRSDPNTGSSGLTSSQYASESAIELSEFPSSSVMEEEHTLHAIQPRTRQRPTATHANVMEEERTLHAMQPHARQRPTATHANVMEEERTLHAMQPHARQRPTATHANVIFENPSANVMKDSGPAYPRDDYESMQLSVKF